MRDAVRVRDFQLGPDYTDTAYEYRHGSKLASPQAAHLSFTIHCVTLEDLKSEGGTRK